MKNVLLFLLTVILASACNDDKKQVESLQKETETIHDEAMKDMAEMNRVARAIKEFMISATMTPEQSSTFTTALTNIGNAENGMMTWMANYKAPTDQPAAEAIKYLQEQKKLIEKNRVEIKAATEAGQKLLQK